MLGRAEVGEETPINGNELKLEIPPYTLLLLLLRLTIEREVRCGESKIEASRSVRGRERGEGRERRAVQYERSLLLACCFRQLGEASTGHH